MEKVSNLATRLKYLMQIKNLRQVDILNRCMPMFEEEHMTFSKSHLSLYVNGKVTPERGKLQLMAKALNVSDLWLEGYDAPMERQEISELSLSEVEQQFLDLFRKLSPQQQDALLAWLRAL